MTEYNEFSSKDMPSVDYTDVEDEVKNSITEIFDRDKLRHNNYSEWFEDTHPYTNSNTDLFVGLGRFVSKIINPLCNRPRFAFALTIIILIIIIIIAIYGEKCNLLTITQIKTSNEEIMYSLKPYTKIANEKFDLLSQAKKIEIRQQMEKTNYNSKYMPLTYTDDTKIINL